MAVSAGASGWSGRRLACASLRSFFGLFLLLGLAPRRSAATTHWVVTEDGKIQQQVREGRGSFQVDAKKVLEMKTFLPSFSGRWEELAGSASPRELPGR